MSKNLKYLLVSGGCLLALCAVAAMLAGVFFITPKIANLLNPLPQSTAAKPAPGLNPDRNSIGDPNAPIHITEFGDFQCPFCKRFHTDTEALLINAYIKTGKVYFTYRSAGNWVSQNIGQGNTESQDAALAAYCAADQNKFWDMHDALFASASGEDQGSFTSERLTAIAKNAGLEMTAYQKCYDSGKYADQVQQDYADTLAAGIHGTPSFIVIYTANGGTQQSLIQGAQPFEAFQQIIDSILKKPGVQG
jgi:protein-disulfide isomerase